MKPVVRYIIAASAVAACVFLALVGDRVGAKNRHEVTCNAVEAIIHPELYEFVRCTAEVDTGDHPGRTFLRPDAAGRYSYIEIKDTDVLAQAMLADLYPE